MTTHRFIFHLIAGAIAISGANCFAQTQTVMLLVGTNWPNPMNFSVTTNQIVQLTGFASAQPPLYGDFQFQGKVSRLALQYYVPYTGLTNVHVDVWGTAAEVTLSITTPTPTTTVVSNYVPADAIVIPASATGNVQIILESSPDLVNWTAASPGTYGASAGTNRFFRVRAAVSP